MDPQGVQMLQLEMGRDWGGIGAGFDPLQMCHGIFLTLVFYSSVLGTALG